MSPTPTGRLFGNDLVLTRRFHAPVADVWASVTDPERTARWFGAWQGDAAPGRTIQVQMAHEEGQPWMDMTIDACEPPRRLALSAVNEHGGWHLDMVLAESGGFARENLSLYRNAAQDSSVEQEFLRAVMLAIASPGSMLPEQTEVAERLVAHCASHFLIGTRSTESMRYFIDMQADASPHRIPLSGRIPATARAFGAGNAIGELHRLDARTGKVATQLVHEISHQPHLTGRVRTGLGAGNYQVSGTERDAGTGTRGTVTERHDGDRGAGVALGLFLLLGLRLGLDLL